MIRSRWPRFIAEFSRRTMARFPVRARSRPTASASRPLGPASERSFVPARCWRGRTPARGSTMSVPTTFDRPRSRVRVSARAEERNRLGRRYVVHGAADTNGAERTSGTKLHHPHGADELFGKRVCGDVGEGRTVVEVLGVEVGGECYGGVGAVSPSDGNVSLSVAIAGNSEIQRRRRKGTHRPPIHTSRPGSAGRCRTAHMIGTRVKPP